MAYTFDQSPPKSGLTSRAQSITRLVSETKELVERLASMLSNTNQNTACQAASGSLPERLHLLLTLDSATVNLEETNKRLLSLVEEVSN